MAWLSGYNKRVKLTITGSKIGGNLTWFPVTVFFTASQAEDIFNEFTSDSNYMKCAFTKDDGITQLYAEMEMFDLSNSKIIYHVSKNDWVLPSGSNTDFYYYYKNTISNNTSYIGAIDTTAGENVWNTDFAGVYHMIDATTSTIKDSTSNNNDGTKNSANNPLEANAKIGNGQYFTNDAIQLGNINLGVSSYTVEFILNIDTNINHNGFTSNNGWGGFNMHGSSNGILYAGTTVPNRITTGTSYLLTNTWYHLVLTLENLVGHKLYKNGVVTHTNGLYSNPSYGAHSMGGAGNQYLDEYRISVIPRSPQWISATYNSLYDTLLVYGEEEEFTGSVDTDNSIFFSFDF